MSLRSDLRAKDFLENETQFHLGFLPTEQSSPLTKGLSSKFAHAAAEGVAMLQSVDRNVLSMLRRVSASALYKRLADDGLRTIRSGGRIVFSGCGATGRLSILLECMWRRACAENPEAARYADQVYSIMTGGDYALVKSVEAFEDHQAFGRRQVADLDLKSGDMLVAITEGGETSSVLGTVFESLDRGLTVFLLFNNPADLLAEHLERSRKAIRDPRVCVLDLSCGPMALAGSTRMQATTSEQLVAGGALEQILDRLLGNEPRDYAGDFEKLLDQLDAAETRRVLGNYIEFEAGIYRKQGFVTYFSGEYLLDIFTDTTERSPTFMLPAFRKNDDAVSPRPWAFVKNPLLTTPEVWRDAMHRPLRCLTWQREDYAAMNAPDHIREDPPRITEKELLKFEVGREHPEDRTVTKNDAAVLILAGASDDKSVTDAFRGIADSFAVRTVLSVGDAAPDADFRIPVESGQCGALRLMKHMALKLILNTISTGTMVVLGRVTDNWMSYVAVSNKKLIDRAIRLVSEIGGIPYEESCRRLFAAIEETERSGAAGTAVVQRVLRDLREKQS